MALLLQPIYSIDTFFDAHEDPRIADLPLMSSPFPTLIIVGVYLYFVKILGPRLMKNRAPFDLHNVLVVYNFLQILLSVYMLHGGAGWLTGHYSLFCQPLIHSNDPKELRMVYISWVYYVAKLTELLDTVFFVLRKKFQQVSVLHVLHHGSMPIYTWIGIKLIPGANHATFFGFLNTFVHVIMYTYYFLSALGPQVQKYLWWKKYLTKLQMVQFGVVFLHSIQLFFNDCDFPRYYVWTIMMQSLIFLFLFSNFYNKTYKHKKLN